MLEHLGNCHGELTLLVSFLASLPFVGARIRRWWKRRQCPCGHEDGQRHA